MPTEEYDVVVVGAGTSGAGTAFQFARLGKSVAVIDSRENGQSGARWVNGVTPWMFERAFIDAPRPPERRSAYAPFSIFGPSGKKYFSIAPSPVWTMDMRLLVRRLRRLGLDAGVTFHDCSRIQDFEFEGDRLRALVVRNAASERRLRADLFVDASGLKAVLRRRVTTLGRWCRPPGNQHLCLAAQGVFAISDNAGAQHFLDRSELEVGETRCQVGVSGGYSICNIAVESEGTIDILTGAIADSRFASGIQILRQAQRRHRFIGIQEFGGCAPIPLRRPYDCFVSPGLALVGDAACQVFPAHGSGIGIGLIAGRVLAEATAHTEDPGNLVHLWQYQSQFQREFGSVLASYDVFRRLTQQLSDSAIESLLGSGLIDALGYEAGLAQRMPSLRALNPRTTMRGVIQQPRLAYRLAPALAKMPLVYAHYRRYPTDPDRRQLVRWSRTIARLFGEPPDAV